MELNMRRHPHARGASESGRSRSHPSTRTDAGQPPAPPAGPTRAAAAVEGLERRLLMAAADLDPGFGAGGKVTTALPLGYMLLDPPQKGRD